MIVPISGGAGGGDMAFGNVPSQASQLIAVSQLAATGRLQPQSAEEAVQSHKSTADQLKGKVA
jgi:hypothetical protein